MGQKPLVSVVLPVYNGERFIVEAVRSVLSQTFRDFECVVVDDGSTDRTAELLATEATLDSRLIIHRLTPNRGFRTALNTGCGLARGEYLARMDADDVSLPDRLEKQVHYLRQHPDVGVVGSAVQLIDQDGARGRIKSFPHESGLAAWSMLFFNSLAHPAVMMRRTELEAVGFYPEGCAGGTEDYAVFLAMSRRCRLANLGEVLLQYRTWPGNMSKTTWEAQERDAVRLLREFLARSFGFTLDADEALGLRGLARDRYPVDAQAALRIGTIIQELLPQYVQDFAGSPTDVESIRTDAGVRLWLLSAVALRHASPKSFALARKAFSTSPRSLGAFVSKVGRRLTGGG